MLTKVMTRKEFLRCTSAFFGLFILSRLPTVATEKKTIAKTPASYGNESYGGAK